MRRMYSENQLKEVVNKGIQEGDIEIPSGGIILTLNLDGVNSGDAIPTTGDFETLIKIMKKEVDASGVYLIIDKAYMKIEGYPVWRDNISTRYCSIQYFADLSDGGGMLACGEFIFYRFYIDWENIARVNITSVSP